MDIFGDFWGMIEGEISWNQRSRVIADMVSSASNDNQLDAIYATLSEDEKKNGWVQQTFRAARGKTAADVKVTDPLKDAIGGLLDDWVETVQKYDMKDPAKAKESLIALTADVMKAAGGALAVELALGLAPNGLGTVASARVSTMMAWLGFGAVVTAVAHDPVKIGLLRPYQDTLEATFRNRRPGDIPLFQAYRTRELTATKFPLENPEWSPSTVDGCKDIKPRTSSPDDVLEALMTRVECENQAYYDREIAKWGYSEEFANALSRSATVTLNFSQLTALARQGLLTRGLAIYSLWGQGLDRVVMKPALDALMKQNEMASYEGFRSLVEPSYVEGDILETDLIAYWDLIAVPKDVQAWVIPRMRKRREAYALKQKTGAAVKERDLTVSQIQQAYQNLLLDRAKSQNMILTLGYSLEEVKIILDLAELRRKLPGAQTLKRLPLSDYEKAHKNGILKIADVLDRMKGEYTSEDIALEKQLLELGKA